MEEAKAMQPVENVSDQEARIRELTEENEHLYQQLHVVQEELEKYYYKLKEYEQNGVDGAVSARLAGGEDEARKFTELAEQLKNSFQVATQNSIEARLGKVLVQGAGSVGGLLALPFRLCGMWRRLSASTPPASLGGKSFQKIIDAYGKGGDSAVDKLLDAADISHVMRANAYTALARHCMPQHVEKAANYARKAWECDPRPYRLKWLASRTCEAGDMPTAEVYLDMLPEGTPMSDSERTQADRIRHQAQREREAASGNAEREETLSREIENLRKTRDEQQREVESLRQTRDEQQRGNEVLRQENHQLKGKVEKITKERENEIYVNSLSRFNIEKKIKAMQQLMNL